MKTNERYLVLSRGSKRFYENYLDALSAYRTTAGSRLYERCGSEYYLIKLPF